MDSTHIRLIEALNHAEECDHMFANKSSTVVGIHKHTTDRLMDYGNSILHECKRRRLDELSKEADTFPQRLVRFIHQPELLSYWEDLRQVPHLVNVVTLAYVKPRPGSDTTIPLDLRRIAKLSSCAYFAPKKFAAVQLAYKDPRARVLVFHTGRLVGTGTSPQANLAGALFDHSYGVCRHVWCGLCTPGNHARRTTACRRSRNLLVGEQF